RPRRLRGVSFLLAIGGRRLPALHCAAFCVPLSRASGRRQIPPVGPRSGAVATAPSSPPRAAPDMGRPVFVPADGWPGPPGARLTRPNRGRRINEPGFPVSSDETTRPHLRPCPSPLLRPRHVSGDAPRRAGQEIIYISSRTGQQSYIKEFLLRRPTRLSWPRGEACAPAPLTPAKAGVQLGGSALGPRFRGDERREMYRAAKTLSRAGWGRPQLQGDPTRLRAARGGIKPCLPLDLGEV